MRTARERGQRTARPLDGWATEILFVRSVAPVSKRRAPGPKRFVSARTRVAFRSKRRALVLTRRARVTRRCVRATARILCGARDATHFRFAHPFARIARRSQNLASRSSCHDD
jgi:hypothetical protein